MKNMPRTPFSTPLSGSAREVKMRLESIAAGPRKRPPVIFIALVSAACLLCGNLVSCNVAEAEVPESSAVQAEADGWTPVELDAGLMQYLGMPRDWYYNDDFPTEEEMDLLENLPADELPREAVESARAVRSDYWQDALLPVAYDEKEDVTIYFVINPDTISGSEPGASPMLGALESRGIVLRSGDRAEYFHLCWDGNAKSDSNPLLLVDDFDSDGKPEAAVVLCLGWGTGAYKEDLYVFDLDTMTCTVPDFTQVPLEISASPDGKTVRLTGGGQVLEMDISELEDRFDGRMEVGNVVRFQQEDGRLFCELDVDFTCDTLGYMARVFFPVVYEDEEFRLGPPEVITADMFAELHQLLERRAP